MTRSLRSSVARFVPRGIKADLKQRAQLRRDPELAALLRLRALPANVPGSTNLAGCPLAYPDAWMPAATYEPIFRRQIYRFDTSAAAPRILDCGANIGLASLYWKRTFPGARITAFEPDPTTVGYLRTNLRSADAGDVEVIEAAVWTDEGTITLAHPDADAGRLASRIVETASAGRDASVSVVPTVRLRDFLDETVDFLKIDIEGAETDVIADCADRLDRVARMFVEYHGFVGRSQLVRLMGTIETAGFDVYVEQEHGGVPSPFVERPDNAGMDVQLNLYCHR